MTHTSLLVSCPDGTHFHVQVPSATDPSSTREVRIPIGQAHLLARMLQARAVADAKRLRIGNDAAPTQHMIEEWLRADRAAQVQARAEALRNKYGNVLDEIEI